MGSALGGGAARASINQPASSTLSATMGPERVRISGVRDDDDDLYGDNNSSGGGGSGGSGNGFIRGGRPDPVLLSLPYSSVAPAASSGKREGPVAAVAAEGTVHGGFPSPWPSEAMCPPIRHDAIADPDVSARGSPPDPSKASFALPDDAAAPAVHTVGCVGASAVAVASDGVVVAAARAQAMGMSAETMLVDEVQGSKMGLGKDGFASDVCSHNSLR